MIKLTMLNGKNVPQFVCDSCDKVIANAKQAAAVFANFTAEGQSTEILHVHKNFAGENCMTKAEQKIRSTGQQSGWEELSTHIAYLLANTGLTEKDVASVLARPDH